MPKLELEGKFNLFIRYPEFDNEVKVVEYESVFHFLYSTFSDMVTYLLDSAKVHDNLVNHFYSGSTISNSRLNRMNDIEDNMDYSRALLLMIGDVFTLYGNAINMLGADIVSNNQKEYIKHKDITVDNISKTLDILINFIPIDGLESNKMIYFMERDDIPHLSLYDTLNNPTTYINNLALDTIDNIDITNLNNIYLTYYEYISEVIKDCPTFMELMLKEVTKGLALYADLNRIQ